MKKITIFVNNQAVYEYDRETIFEERQLEFFDKMDIDMERGIKIHSELITNPDSKQRAKFVVMNLIKALQQDNPAIISASCAYLANRLPALFEVHVNEHGITVNIELVEEQYN
jgi:hypothetical protein